MTATFRDRGDAGRALAPSLGAYAGRDDLLVLGMARGGVPVARAVADALGAPLDVAVARKLGVPGVEEVALGAVADGDGRVDLAGDTASRVRAPTLLVVVGDDTPTLEWNRRTLPRLPNARLVVVPGAGHTFEEPGALGAVGEHAAAWLERHVLGRGVLRRAIRRVRFTNGTTIRKDV